MALHAGERGPIMSDGDILQVVYSICILSLKRLFLTVDFSNKDVYCLYQLPRHTKYVYRFREIVISVGDGYGASNPSLFFGRSA